MLDVITIGSTTRDNFIEGDYKLIDWPETPSGKAIALPFAEKIYAEKVHFTIGGNSANAAVTFARQGFKTAVIAKIGKDLPGKEIIARLKEDGISTKFIKYSDKLPTAYSALLLKGGERTIIGYHGASDELDLEDFPESKIKAKWWYVSLAGESDKIYPELIAMAKKNGIKIATNPSGHHIHHRRQEILDSLKNVDVLVLNEGEAADLVGVDFHKESEVFKKLDEFLSPGIVAVTDGSRGVTVSDGKNVYKAGIFKERMVADRTGAGDSFASGFVSVLARGGTIEEAIRFASANATSVVERVGATEGILKRGEYEKSDRWTDFKIDKKPL